ncbi:hypothetical protein A3C91_02030 [Candidatus Azambacteria bacterium RIFCSPHIGHO2_02_FULL_52_12]|uniref:DNA polymerase III subunit delta n=1 Tax=Candidatus Azambacteria bacterium RIFCSPLOWO2_01_FULL_46_25 TaxID=1797298 RepID=A0A1F5BVK0_9BACT|nr:MAG: hypothetical protein A3C91_02030 [Candidatus Azambacteria bacterium RIFCSPHIGHO2_02_FULL_52_12]OGD34616.1 MAG: hypothetical protein A2988_03890 [Candidatus Azambacteria bacterium RIFCSPLOWO2_01_FULL_46_25]
METSSITAQLENLFSEGKHAHAYLFYGIGVADKKEAALACARIATGIEDEGVRANPDVLVIGVREGEQGISIDDIRGIGRFLSFEPYFGKHKVVIIEEFERMKTEASSALLKILEEPPGRSTFILLSDHPHLLLHTVLSRVHKVDFSAGENAQDIDKIKEICNTLSVLICAHKVERFALIEQMVKGGDHEDIFEELVSFFHDMLYVTLKQDALVSHQFHVKEYQRIAAQKNYTPRALEQILSRLVAGAHIVKTTNANKRLILENIALSF